MTKANSWPVTHKGVRPHQEGLTPLRASAPIMHLTIPYF
jgi:hypothetical protein